MCLCHFHFSIAFHTQTNFAMLTIRRYSWSTKFECKSPDIFRFRFNFYYNFDFDFVFFSVFNISLWTFRILEQNQKPFKFTTTWTCKTMTQHISSVVTLITIEIIYCFRPQCFCPSQIPFAFFSFDQKKEKKIWNRWTQPKFAWQHIKWWLYIIPMKERNKKTNQNWKKKIQKKSSVRMKEGLSSIWL